MPNRTLWIWDGPRIDLIKIRFFLGSISNAANITIYQSVNERFLEVFRDHVEQNPRQSGENEELEPCIGCMSETANIKLIRRCTGNGSAAAGKDFFSQKEKRGWFSVGGFGMETSN
jgi:hypothetical protein